LATQVYLELGGKRVFACAYEWPGWCRSGRDEDAALEALRAYVARYAIVAKAADLKAPDDRLEVVERLKGSASTDFGVPGAIAKRDADRLTPAAQRRLLKLVQAAWTVFDDVVAGAPQSLRKGPRGGGRDRDKMVDHVYGAESGYARQLRRKLDPPAIGDTSALLAFRAEILDALEHPAADSKWPVRYAARRIAWHALDHAWEMEDRS
jgi:hypothetical protein